MQTEDKIKLESIKKLKEKIKWQITCWHVVTKSQDVEEMLEILKRL